MSEIFRAIARDIKNQGKIGQVIETECTAVLEDKVRPAIRRASEEIDSKQIIYMPDEQEPRILVLGDNEKSDELRFICSGRVLRIISIVRGKEMLPVERDIMSIVTDAFVEEQIASFLRRSLKRHSPSAGQ